MIDGINNLASGAGIGGSPASKPAAPTTGGTNFSDMLSKSIDEVSRLQQDASQAVDNITTGKSEDVDGVMTAVEKSDLAFKTLLAIRAKLMDAYEEIKGMPI
ncbi:MAG TPA: flagellar hook-basal body complex protein FliE [Humisphaera sp.]|jgi:flagellar hook-basal body complex protein FliE|nr:flagellar hook-basal body complex protein FliE [Humisphaera sp.]